MRNYTNAFILLYRSKVLVISLMLTIFFVVWQALTVYGSPIVTIPLGNAMVLTIYLFIMFMLVSFEYMKKLYNNGVSETLLVTNKGKKRHNCWAGFFVMSTISVIISIIIIVIVINEYLFYKIADPNSEYKFHIIKCVILHDFLVMELAIVIGTALAVIKNRMVTYVIMTVFILASCPFATSMAHLIFLSALEHKIIGKIAFKIISHFYIVPRFDMDFLPQAPFGESLLPDRFFIILFWMFLFLTIICITRKKKLIYSVVLFIASIAMLIGYNSPVARMGYGMDLFYCGDPEWLNVENVRNREEAADYKILQYDMNLSLNVDLNATVSMKVSKSLDEYKMTLYKKYKVKRVTDQDGNKLEYSQDGDYLVINNTAGNNITEIILNYSGNTYGYYSNYQCCFLPAYFLYYPRAGFIPVVDTTYAYIYYNYVDEDTIFNVKVDHPERYISNLKLVNGQFQGKSDGFTLIKGFYKKKDLGNGNTLVYPYLDNFIVHDGKKSEEECWKETFDISITELKKDNVKDTLLFFDDKLSMDQGWTFGKKQFFIQSEPPIYYSGMQ